MNMKYEELKAKFMPRVVASQMEFDEVMRGINHEQTLDNHPLLDETRKLNARQSLIRMQIQSLHAQESAVKTERIHIEQVQKDINRAYHQLKKDWIACNPKQPRIGGGGTATDNHQAPRGTGVGSRGPWLILSGAFGFVLETNSN